MFQWKRICAQAGARPMKGRVATIKKETSYVLTGAGLARFVNSKRILCRRCRASVRVSRPVDKKKCRKRQRLPCHLYKGSPQSFSSINSLCCAVEKHAPCVRARNIQTMGPQPQLLRECRTRFAVLANTNVVFPLFARKVADDPTARFDRQVLGLP